AGNVTITSSTATFGGSVEIVNGTITSGGPFAPGANPGSGDIHLLGTVQAFNSFAGSTGSGNINIDSAVLGNTITMQAGANSTITVGTGFNVPNIGIFSTGSSSGSDFIGLKAGTIDVTFGANVAGAGISNDIPITFLANQVLNNGTISTVN